MKGLLRASGRFPSLEPLTEYLLTTRDRSIRRGECVIAAKRSNLPSPNDAMGIASSRCS